MPLHQNVSVTTSKLIIGNYKIEVASSGTSAGGTWANLGAGMVSKFGHNITRYKVQAGNAPDPMEGISEETFTVDAELIEYDASVLNVIQAGATVADTSTSSTQTVLKGGGQEEITPVAFKLTNRRLISSATHETVILIFKATVTTGPQFTAKSDNDADPINTMQISIEGKNDSTLSVGSQLYTITRDL
jgi:hypothetical protein